MKLERDKRWEVVASQSAASLERFADEIVPELFLVEAVPKNVRESVALARELLIHSYYQYEFIDIAAGKLLHILEMALKIRYSELNENQPWPKNKNLEWLIEYFRKGCYFERTEKEFLHALRKMRNNMSHPSDHEILGYSILVHLNKISYLINDLYGDVELRKERIKFKDYLNEYLDKLKDHGAAVLHDAKRFIIFDAGVLFVDNLTSQDSLNILVYYKCIYELESELEPDEDRENHIRIFEINSAKSESEMLKALSNGPNSFAPLHKEENLKRLKVWKSGVAEEDEAFDSFLSHQLLRATEERIKKVLYK